MARRGGERFEKRRLEAARRERQASKRDKKPGTDEAGEAGVDGVQLTEAEAMERFAALSARRASGDVDEETYEAEGRELFATLGLEWPTDV